jgi:hypothetical protein
VFQAHTDLLINENLLAARNFFEALVHDNAIGYTTENNSWSFGYYLNNAIFRLRDVHTRLDESSLKSQVDAKLAALAADTKQPTSLNNSQNTWDDMHEMFYLMVKHLRGQLGIS